MSLINKDVKGGIDELADPRNSIYRAPTQEDKKNGRQEILSLIVEVTQLNMASMEKDS